MGPVMRVRQTADYVRTAIDRAQTRSLVMTTGGIVASEHPLASQAGASILARRQRGGRRYRRQRGDGRRRPDDERHRRRSLRHRLRLEWRGARPQRQRLCACGADGRRAARDGCHEHAADRHSVGDRAGLRRRVDAASGKVRAAPARRPAVTGDPDCGRRLSRAGDHRARVVGRPEPAARRPRSHARVSAGGARTGRGNGVSESRSRRHVSRDSVRGPRRLLSRRHRETDAHVLAAPAALLPPPTSTTTTRTGSIRSRPRPGMDGTSCRRTARASRRS